MAEFSFDECLPGAAKVLINDGFDVLHPGHAALPGVYLGARDTEWMPRVAAEGLIAVTRDRRINRNRSEREMIRAEGLKVVWLTGRADLRSWMRHTSPPSRPGKAREFGNPRAPLDSTPSLRVAFGSAGRVRLAPHEISETACVGCR